MQLDEFDAHRATVQTRTNEISYADFGTGRTALFIHGLGTNGYLWRNLAEELRDEYRCLAIDLPGHGRSPVRPEQEHTLSALADAVAEFCDELGLDKIDLIANDTGGAISQIFATRHPQRLTTLTLTNCEVHDNIPNQLFRPTVERAKRGELAHVGGRLLDNLDMARSPHSLGGSYEDPSYPSDELLRSYLIAVGGSPEGARQFERLLGSLDPSNLLDVEDELRKLTVPTLIVWGTDDNHFDLPWAYWLRDNIPGAEEVVELKGARLHFVDERAAEFAAHVRRHLAAHPASDDGRARLNVADPGARRRAGRGARYGTRNLGEDGNGMPTIGLGGTGLEVSAVGLGCMGMSEFYGPADHDTSLTTMRRAVELGINFFDTSDAYGIGANERLIGEFLAGARRDGVRIATKFGVLRDPDSGAPVGMRGDAAYVQQACDASLRRLGVDHLDLYYVHTPDPKVPIEETVGAMSELVAAGKVGHLGLSNITAEQLRAAHGVHPIAAVQNEWSLFTREAEESLVPACAELGVGFVPYSPLGRGFLTGEYTSAADLGERDYRRAIPRFSEENAAHNAQLLNAVQDVAKKHEATPGQIALAWLIQQRQTHGLAVVPIPGTRHPARLAENARAADIRLTPDDIEALEPIAAQVAGGPRPAPPPAIAQGR